MALALRRFIFHAFVAGLGLLFSQSGSADTVHAVSVLSVPASVSPARDQVAEIEVLTAKAGKLKLEIIEPDGNSVRTITRSSILEAGKHKLIWDGKDDKGAVVPDEAYSVRVHLIDSTGAVLGTADPASGTGGELLDGIRPSLESNSVGFKLSDSARVLVRIGLKQGPMMANLLRWEPRVAGKNRVAWDGFDRSGVFDIRQHPQATAMVVGYRLPDHSIITYGNDAVTYKDWFAALGLKPKVVPVEQQLLARGDRRIAREYYRSVFEDREPRLVLDILQAGKKAEKPYIIQKAAVLRVNADKDSEWLLNESLYEVGFFVDGEFVAEEEQGYLPLSWRLNPERFGPGEHVLTVNINGFDGRVGTVSTVFEVE